MKTCFSTKNEPQLRTPRISVCWGEGQETSNYGAVDSSRDTFMGQGEHWREQLNSLLGVQKGSMKEMTFVLRCEGRQQILITSWFLHQAWLMISPTYNLDIYYFHWGSTQKVQTKRNQGGHWVQTLGRGVWKEQDRVHLTKSKSLFLPSPFFSPTHAVSALQLIFVLWVHKLCSVCWLSHVVE